MHGEDYLLVRFAVAVVVRFEIAAHRLWTQVAGFRIDVDEHRFGASLNDAGGGRDEGHWSGDDFVAGTHVKRHQCEAQRVGSGTHSDDVTHAEKPGELLFEGLDVRTADVSGIFVDL